MHVKYHQHQYQYCLATRFIDDKLLSITKKIDGVKQVVFLTDGMNTRPYRLNWPTSTMIFDNSPEEVFRRATQKLEGSKYEIFEACSLLEEIVGTISSIRKRSLEHFRALGRVPPDEKDKDLADVFLSITNERFRRSWVYNKLGRVPSDVHR